MLKLLLAPPASSIVWKESKNKLGLRIFETSCPYCQKQFKLEKHKGDFYRHLAFEHNQLTGNPSKPKKAINLNTSPTPPEPKRIFYVDTARSVKTKNGTKYWKSAIVENGKKVVDFVNSKTQSGNVNGSEAFGILKVIHWVIENQIKEKVVIKNDNMLTIKVLQGKNLAELEKKYPRRNDRDKTHFQKYIWCIQNLIKKHNLQVKFKFVKGKYNLADYFSRVNYKSWDPQRQGRQPIQNKKRTLTHF
jgi:hypothetical protein